MNILILVCALSVAAPDCQKDTALHIFHAPPSGVGLAGCARQGLLFAAESHLATRGSYAKVVCRSGVRTGTMAKVREVIEQDKGSHERLLAD